MTDHLARMIADAADSDPGEPNEPALCPCGRGYCGHADDARNGHRCEDHPGAVAALDFRRRRQLYRDTWRRIARRCDRIGPCVICGTIVHAFTDGENDPRGPLGNHSAGWSLSPEDYEDIRTGAPFPPSLPTVPLCPSCGNDYERCRAAEDLARQLWRRAS
jgi:hypothetical protein